MRAAVFHGAGDVRLSDVSIPSPRAEEVLVKVHRAGICGSNTMNEKQILGSLIYQRKDFAEAIRILAQGAVDTRRHITGEIPLEAIVARGFLPQSETRAQHIKIQVYPEGANP